MSQIVENQKKRDEIMQLLSAFSELSNAWDKTVDAVNNFDTEDINEFICGIKGEDDTKYPFDKSFDEISVHSWIEGIKSLCQSALSKIPESETSDVLYKKEEKCECCGKDMGKVEKELFEVCVPTGNNQSKKVNMCLDCMMKMREEITRKAKVLLVAEKNEINEIKKNFNGLRVVWNNCCETTFCLDAIDINKYISSDEQKYIDYPFPKDMCEMGVTNWCLMIDGKCDQRLRELEEIEERLYSAD